MTNDPKTLKARLLKIADAARREDGSDIPLGEQIREALARIETLEAALRETRPCVLGYIDRCDYSKGRAILAVLDASLNGGSDHG